MIKETVKQMVTIMSTPEQRQIIWNRKLAQMDYDTQMESARNAGKAEGLAEGLHVSELRLPCSAYNLSSLSFAYYPTNHGTEAPFSWSATIQNTE